jgi:phosphoribosylformylglycinamidine synthase
MSVRAMVLRAAGTNCDRESVHAVELAGGTADRVHVNTLCATPALLDNYGLLVLPGGFSYGDDVAAGRLFGNQLKLRCGEAFERFIAKGGVAIGICNGFQVLIGAGLLPGADLSHKVTLSLNASGKFEDRWVWCETPATHSPLLEEGERVLLPVANAEGRILTDGDATTAALIERRQVAFRYVDADGGPVGYPGNPNGSVDSIAGTAPRAHRRPDAAPALDTGRGGARRRRRRPALLPARHRHRQVDSRHAEACGGGGRDDGVGGGGLGDPDDAGDALRDGAHRRHRPHLEALRAHHLRRHSEGRCRGDAATRGATVRQAAEALSCQAGAPPRPIAHADQDVDHA